jgi:hypothetical protein
MGWNPNTLPDRVKELIDQRDRPGGKAGKAWRTQSEIEQDNAHQSELELHEQFWSFLRRNNFEDVEYSNPHRATRARKGRPDFLICRNSRRLGIEFKVHPNVLSPEQIAFFEMAQREKNRCVVCFDYETAIQETNMFFSDNEQNR